jgi:hypothetical protein
MTDDREEIRRRLLARRKRDGDGDERLIENIERFLRKGGDPDSAKRTLAVMRALGERPISVEDLGKYGGQLAEYGLAEAAKRKAESKS